MLTHHLKKASGFAILPSDAIRGEGMPKTGGRPGRKAKTNDAPARAFASKSERRVPAAIDPVDAGSARRSDAMRLAEEVARLARELAAARARMADLEARAEIDPLTDVLNRRGFERELKRSLAHAKRYGTSAALIYIDLDGFKAVNDRHGHAAGDTLLRAVAAVLARHIRASDVVARLGGDEFAVLLWHLTEDDAQSKARALEAAVSRTTATHGDATFAAGASAGAALLLPLDQPADVLDRADRDMYRRKDARKIESRKSSRGDHDPGGGI
jgi:diguanylate cyclase (GGDEF)-like protein